MLDQILAKVDPTQAVFILAIIALYVDSRRDRQRYQDSMTRITEMYESTLKHTTEMLGSMKTEISLLAQRIGRPGDN